MRLPAAALVGDAIMEHVGSDIDWYLVGTDSTAGCLFVAGLFALLVGLSALGLGLWAACVWLDYRVLAYLRAAPADPGRVRQYVNRRVTTNGIAQVLAMVWDSTWQRATTSRWPSASGWWQLRGSPAGGC